MLLLGQAADGAHIHAERRRRRIDRKATCHERIVHRCPLGKGCRGTARYRVAHGRRFHIYRNGDDRLIGAAPRSFFLERSREIRTSRRSPRPFCKSRLLSSGGLGGFTRRSSVALAFPRSLALARGTLRTSINDKPCILLFRCRIGRRGGRIDGRCAQKHRRASDEKHRQNANDAHDGLLPNRKGSSTRSNGRLKTHLLAVVRTSRSCRTSRVFVAKLILIKHCHRPSCGGALRHHKPQLPQDRPCQA